MNVVRHVLVILSVVRALGLGDLEDQRVLAALFLAIGASALEDSSRKRMEENGSGGQRVGERGGRVDYAPAGVEARMVGAGCTWLGFMPGNVVTGMVLGSQWRKMHQEINEPRDSGGRLFNGSARTVVTIHFFNDKFVENAYNQGRS